MAHIAALLDGEACFLVSHVGKDAKDAETGVIAAWAKRIASGFGSEDRAVLAIAADLEDGGGVALVEAMLLPSVWVVSYHPVGEDHDGRTTVLGHSEEAAKQALLAAFREFAVACHEETEHANWASVEKAWDNGDCHVSVEELPVA